MYKASPTGAHSGTATSWKRIPNSWYLLIGIAFCFKKACHIKVLNSSKHGSILSDNSQCIVFNYYKVLDLSNFTPFSNELYLSIKSN